MPTAEPAAMACTLDPQAMGPRLERVRQLTREHLRAHRLDGRTLRVTYAAAATHEVTRIVELERACCAFLDFEIEGTADGVVLSITAPEQAGAEARWLFAQFLPVGDQTAEPASKTSACACCCA